MEAYVRDIDLNFFVVVILSHQLTASSCMNTWIILPKLFPDLKESFFYLFFNFWLELLLHVIHFELLPFEIIQGVLSSLNSVLIFTWLLSNLSITGFDSPSHVELRILANRWQFLVKIAIIARVGLLVH